MKQSRIFFNLPFLLLLFVVVSQTTSAQTLPAKVKSYLDKTYSGWKPSTASKYCNSSTTNDEITGDFDRNGKTDYAVKIKRGSKGYVIAFLGKGANYTPFVLENKSATNIDDTALDLKEGKILVTNCETSAYFYVYKSGKFTRKFISD